MKVRLSNINCQLAFQHASSAILTRQTADRWLNTRGWRSHEVFKINAVWITIWFRWYFSILQPTLQLSFMISVLFKQEHSTVKNSRNFESRIAKIPTKNFSSSNFRQAWGRRLQRSMVRMTSFTRSPGNFHTKYCTCVCCVCRGSFRDKASLYLSGRYQ